MAECSFPLDTALRVFMNANAPVIAEFMVSLGSVTCLDETQMIGLASCVDELFCESDDYYNARTVDVFLSMYAGELRAFTYEDRRAFLADTFPILHRVLDLLIGSALWCRLCCCETRVSPAPVDRLLTATKAALATSSSTPSPESAFRSAIIHWVNSSTVQSALADSPGAPQIASLIRELSPWLDESTDGSHAS
jgi:hypothetical protein